MGKKGVSIVIGYVLLVVIAISLSLLVYAWLKYFIPGEAEKCPDEVSLIVSSYSCRVDINNITLILRNQGNFNIDGFIFRIRNESEGFYYNLKQPNAVTVENFFGNAGGEPYGGKPYLAPNEEVGMEFYYGEHNKIVEMEIEPLLTGEKGDLIPCENAIISQEVIDCD